MRKREIYSSIRNINCDKMAGEGGTLSFSVASVVEDVLQQHGNRLGDLDLESRKAEEAGSFIFFPFSLHCSGTIHFLGIVYGKC